MNYVRKYVVFYLALVMAFILASCSFILSLDKKINSVPKILETDDSLQQKWSDDNTIQSFQQEITILDIPKLQESSDAFVQEELSDGSLLIKALNSYFGEWEIVEDFGYRGIHRSTETIAYEIGNSVFFQRDTYHYNDKIDVSYPIIKIEITSSAKMQQFDGMQYPHNMGFDNQYAVYAKVLIYNHTKLVSNFYILNDNEIIIEGDTHRYYKAVRKIK